MAEPAADVKIVRTDADAQAVVDEWVRFSFPDPVSDRPGVWAQGLDEGRYSGEVFLAHPGSAPGGEHGYVQGGDRREQRAAAMLADAFARPVKVMWGPAPYDHGDFRPDEPRYDPRDWEDGYLFRVADPGLPHTMAIVPHDGGYNPAAVPTAGVPEAAFRLAEQDVDRRDLIEAVAKL